MRYLAVAEMPRRNLLASIRNRGHRAPEWHAVVDSHPKPIKTLCGMSYTAEAHRTWDQTAAADRCPNCERLIMISPNKSKGATFIAERSTSRGRT